MEFVKAFIIGGIICALVQILMEKTKMLPGRIMVLLVCLGVALGLWGCINRSLILPAPAPRCR